MNNKIEAVQTSLTSAIEFLATKTGASNDQVKKALAVAGLTLGAYGTWKAFFSSTYNLPPGPRALPLVGSVFTAGRNPRGYLLFDDLKKQYGDIVLFHLGPQKTVILNSADLVREAYLRDGVAFADRPKLLTFEMFSDGGQDIVAAQYSSRLQIQRKVALSALRQYASGKALERHINNGFTAMRKLLDKKGSFYPIELGYLFAFNLIASMCFGRKFELNDPFLQDMMGVQREFESAFDGPEALLLILPIMKYFPTRITKIAKKFTKISHEFLGGCLEEHLQSYDPKNLTDFTYYMIHSWKEAEEDPNERNKLKQLSHKHFTYILLDLFLAGTDTTRQTLAWIWLYLAAYPEVQEKAQREVDEILGDNEITVDSREKLPYVDAVVHEVMRIMPVVPTGVPRQTLQDTKLNGYDIPKGTMVMNNTWSIHHDERLWKDPFAFLPERWLDESGQYYFQQNGFLPFSVGRRSCIGESFAKLEIHMVIALILQSYTLKPEPGKRIDLEPIKSGIVRARDQKVIAEPRKK